MTDHRAHAASPGQPGTRGLRPHGLPGRPRPPRSLRSRHRPRQTAGATAVTLRDGSVVQIRQIRATDAPLVAGIFARLSPTSRWMRFLAAKNHLTEAELRYLTDIDHHGHDAFTALGPGGHGLGVARYIRHPHHPHTAEIAIAVVDDWHRRGLATHLLTRLADRAHRAGISRFAALTSADNQAMAGLLHTMGAEVTNRTASTVEYQIALPIQTSTTATLSRPRDSSASPPGGRNHPRKERNDRR